MLSRLKNIRATQVRLFATAEKSGKSSKNPRNTKKAQAAGEGGKATVEALQKFIDTAEAAKRYLRCIILVTP